MTDKLTSRTSGSLAYVRSDDILSDVCAIIDLAQDVARRTVDVTYVQRNWLIGRRIVEEEMEGERRARYGGEVIASLARNLTLRYGRGYTKGSLWQYARFYRMYPSIVPTSSEQFGAPLTWSHYEELLRVADPVARTWYEHEASSQTWSVRTLRRNINTQYYDRMLSTQALAGDPDLSVEEEAALRRLEFVKNPVMAEFLGLSPDDVHRESTLEAAIIANLQKFLLELGKGYAFVARQQHVRTDAGDYYIDLVFYNVILKCYVLIDLKVGQVSHADVGQMDMYVRMYDELRRTEGDGPTLGIVLCSETSADIAHYSVLSGSDQLFASKYKLYLPTEEQLRAEIEAQKSIYLAQASGGGGVAHGALPEATGSVEPSK